jgi:signal peptidase I
VTKEESSRGRGNSFVETILIVAVALGLALGIQAFLIKPYRIPSESMVPTLTIGQRVLVNRIGNNFGDPAIGDVTVFHPPAGAENGKECGAERQPDQPCPRPTREKADVNFIKRIVAGPGDKLRIEDGHVVRNGKRQAEPFAEPCGGGEGCDMPTQITIPKDHYFMMGDNRGASDDSRFWGPVPRDWIIGNAFATYWPPKRIGLL